MNWIQRLFDRRTENTILQILNIPDLGKKPEWKELEGVMHGAQGEPRIRAVIHLLLFHLGDSRAEHEDAPGAPADFVSFQRGRASAANQILSQLLALLRGRSEELPARLKKHFGWTEEKRKEEK